MRFLALEESVEIPGAGGTDRPATDISLGRQRSLMFQNPIKVWGPFLWSARLDNELATSRSASSTFR